MTFLARLRSWFSAAFRRSRMESDMDAELRFHIEAFAADLVRSGLAPDEALRRARLEFGAIDKAKEECRESRGITWLHSLAQDVRFGLRMLRKSPGVALGTIILLALGMGGVMTLFGPLYSLVLAPLPFPHSDRLVRMGGRVPVFEDYFDTFLHRRELDPIFSAVAAYSAGQVSLSGEGPPEELDVAGVTPEFFATIGVLPRQGRDFSDRATDAHVAVVSDRFWRDRMHADPHAVGRSILLEGAPFAVVGVMPPDFDFPPGVQIWAPARSVNLQGASQCIGRMRAGMSLKKAAAGLKTVDSGPEPPGANGYASFDGPVLQPLHTFLLGDRRPLLWILSAVSLLFLFLACAGAANLLLARAVGRRPEMVVRLALGAGRKRLLRQLLTETSLLAVVAGLLALGLSMAGSRALQLFLPAASGAASISPAVVPLVIFLAFAGAVLCGLAPALHATGGDLNASLKTGNSGITAFSHRRRFFASHELLAGAQLVLAMILLISTGLLLRSLVAHLRVPLGFQPKDVVVVETDLPELAATTEARRSYELRHHLDASLRLDRAGAIAMFRALKPTQDAEDTRNELFYRAATDQLAHLPGAISAGVFTAPPFEEGSQNNGSLFSKLDRRVLPRAPRIGCLTRHAAPGAFGVLGIRLLAGRDFVPSDAVDFAMRWNAPREGPNSPDAQIIPEVIINEALARRFWPDQSPIGQELFWARSFRFTVVGLVSDIHELPNQLDAQPTVYYPFEFWTGKAAFVVKLRPGTSIAAFAPAAKRTLAAIESDLPPPTITSLQSSATASLANLRLALALLSCFSLLGLVVAALSVYATATLMSSARTRELGIRIALGATAEQIRGLALWRSLRVALFALPLGALSSWLLTRTLSHWLFQVAPADPLTFIAVAFLLTAVALLACYVPARRAMRVDPVIALRSE